MSEMTASDTPVLDLLANMTAEIRGGIEQASAQMADDELN